MTRICIVLALLACTPGCHPQAQPTVETVEYVNAAAQRDLDEALRIVLSAEPKVEFLCEMLPDSKACGVLTATVNKFYSLAVFVQDSIDAGNDVTVELSGLLSVARKLYNAADMAYRSVA